MYDKLTENDIKKMQEEIDYRKLVVRPKELEAVKEARAQGDLSENFEYKAAKQDKNRNESRIRYLEKMIKTAHVISDTSKDDEVGINNTVQVYIEEDDESNVMEEQTRIKICGLTRLEDIDAVNELKPEYVGFVFAKSRRQITKEHAVTLRRYLDPEIQAVGVFVNELPAIVAGYLEEGVIDLAQLHGNESEEYIHSLRFRTGGELIKAFSIKTREDVEKAKKSSADYILLDHGKGGTGESFDWSLIRNMDRPYFLAGGLNAENVEQAILQTHPFAVDISSGVETDGVKDPKKITECIRRIRHV